MRGLASARAIGRIGGKPKGLTYEAKLKAKKAYANRMMGLTVQKNLLLTNIKSKDTLFKHNRFEVERLSKESGQSIADNGLELLQYFCGFMHDLKKKNTSC